MSTRAGRWRERQQRAAARLPQVTVDGGRVKRRWFRGGYAVTIRGAGLLPMGVPVTVVVGGQRMRDLRFSEDGRTLRGVIDARPRDRAIVVDYGFMRGVGSLSRA